MNIRLPCDLLNDAYDTAMANIAYEQYNMRVNSNDFFNMLDGCAFE